MKLALPSFRGWRALVTSPSVRSMAGATKRTLVDFLKPIADIVGWAFGGLFGGILSWSMTSLVSLFVGGVQFVWNFNWNIPDEDLLTVLENQKLAWYGQFGETIGAGLGWLVCGIIPSASILLFNKPMALYVLYEVGEEAYEELTGSLASLLQLSYRQQLNATFIHFFIAIRWLIKNSARGESDTLAGGLVTKILDKFPKLKEGVNHWGDKGGKPWIISQAVEDAIEDSPLPNEWKEFLEELIEGFGEACTEALFTFANAFDNYVASQAVINNQQTQPNTVVITPNRLAPDEKIILHGTQEQLKTQITQSLANYQLVYNRDMGYDLGTPLIERAHKQISEYVITLFLRDKPKPPYGRDAKRHQISINSADKIKFTDFDKVIRALGGGGEGGNIGYMYGYFNTEAFMSDGSIPQVWTDTRDNGIVRIEAITELSEAKIQTINVMEEIKDYQRKKIEGLAKDIYRVYPWKMDVLRKTKIYNDYDVSNNTVPGNTKNTKQGYYKHSRQYTFELWQGGKPANWDTAMQELTAFIPTTPAPAP